jgi:hypothetical protein
MECHHARLLLAFWRRPADELDAEEQAALRQHLEACRDCALLARDERRADGALGPPMREVAVPDGLQERIVNNLAARPRRFPAWIASAAAAVLLAVAGLGYRQFTSPSILTNDLLANLLAQKNAIRSAEQAEAWFRDHHQVDMKAPRQFKYAYFNGCNLVDFQGQRVPMLTFRGDNGELAQVYVLASAQFDIGSLAHQPGSGFTIFNESDVAYLAVHPGAHLPPSLTVVVQ